MNTVIISPSYALERDTQNWPKSLVHITDQIQVFEANSGHPTFVTAPQIYRDQIIGWYFNVGDRLTSPAAGFVILMIVAGFLEMHGQLLFGESSANKSKRISCKCFVEIMRGRVSIPGLNDNQLNQALDKVAECLYQNVRSGLFHEMMIRHGIELRALGTGNPIEVNWDKSGNAIEGIILDPKGLLVLLKNYFEEYIMQLASDKSSQTNFVNGWNAIITYRQTIEPEGYKQLKSTFKQQNSTINPNQYGGTVSSGFPSWLGSDSPYKIEWRNQGLSPYEDNENTDFSSDS